MKNQPFFITRWWRDQALQTRLFLAFTFLFAFSILVLSLFLNNVIQMIRINRESQAIFEQNRQIYQIKASVAQYQLALQSYENSITDRSYAMAEQAMNTYGKQVTDKFTNFNEQVEIDPAQKDLFTSSNDEIAKITQQVKQTVTTAINTQDQAAANAEWDKVQALDKQASTAFEKMNQVVNNLQKQGLQELAAANAEAEQISLMNWITTLVAFPIFLLVAVLVALVIYRQINQPLQQLTEATQAVQADSFQVQTLDKLAERGGEIGTITRLFIHMAESIDDRTALLRQEADAIRAKIR